MKGNQSIVIQFPPPSDTLHWDLTVIAHFTGDLWEPTVFSNIKYFTVLDEQNISRRTSAFIETQLDCHFKLIKRTLITMHRNIEEICGEPHFSVLLSKIRGNQSSLWLHFHTCLLKMGFPGFFQHFSLKDLILYFFIESESEHYLASSVLSLTALSLTNSCCWDFKWCDFDWQCYLWCCHWYCWRWRYSRRQILTSYY